MTSSRDTPARPAIIVRGGWTDEAVETLKRLWADPDLSAAMVARRLDVTRNAIIGKVHRLGLSKPRASRTPPTRVPSVQSGRRLRARHPAPAEERVSATSRNDLAARTSELGPGLVRRLEDLPRQGCRWPLGDPKGDDFAFCGRLADRGSYCAAHAAVAYRGPGVETAELARLLRR